MAFENYWFSSGAEAGGGGGPDPGTPIGESLRLRGLNNCWLTRTFSNNGNQQIFTISGWMKPGLDNIAVNQGGPMINLLGTGSGGANQDNYAFYETTGSFFSNTAANTSVFTANVTRMFRDPAAWYHVVVSFNSPAAAEADRFRVWINGELQTFAAGATLPAQNANSPTNSGAREHFIGCFNATAGTMPANGYIADFYFLDGTPATADNFGRFNENGIWVPDPDDFTAAQFGVNGYHLTFANDANIGADTAPTGATGHTAANNWTVNNGFVTDDTSEDYDVMIDSPTQNFSAYNALTPPGAGADVDPLDANLTLRGATGITIGEKPPGETIYFELQTGFVNNGGQWGNWWNEILILNGQTQAIAGGGNNVAPANILNQGGFAFDISANIFANNVDEAVAINNTNLAANDIIGVQIDDNNITIFINGVASTGVNNLAFANNFDDGMYIYGRNASNAGNPGEFMHINFGQRPFENRPAALGDGNNLQTQNMPNVTIRDGGTQFRAFTGQGPDTTITAVTQTATGNYTVTNWMGSTGSGTPENDGYTSNLSEPGATAPNSATANNSAAMINNSMTNFGGIGTGNAGGRGTMHSTRFVFDPPLTGPVEFQTSIFTGANQSSMVINGTAQNTSAMTSNEEPFQTFNDDIENIVIFGQSATYNTWFTIQTVDGVVTGGFVDNEYEITVADATGFAVNDPVENDAGELGYITAIDGNVLTVTAQVDNGWVVGSSLSADTGILELAQTAFETGLYWIKDIDNSNNWQLACSEYNVAPTDNVVITNGNAYSPYTAPTGNSVAYCWNLADTEASGCEFISDTGTGTARTVNHNLGRVPQMIWAYNMEEPASNNVWVYHSAFGPGGALNLSNVNLPDARDIFWGGNPAQFTTTTFGVGSAGSTNPSGPVYYWLWAEIPGYSAFGSYQGNGNADGPFVYLGFRPAFVLFKNINAENGWTIFDTTRNPINNDNMDALQPNTDEDQTPGYDIYLLSNGFKLRDNTGDFNASNTYVYACFAENPFGGRNTVPVTAR
jgi:hypothetical protein